jgi:hypothetical protein
MAKDKKIDSHGRQVERTIKDRIIWLTSWPKSGNTWVRAFLSCYKSGSLNINHLQFITGDLNPYVYQNVLPKPLPDCSDLDILMGRNAAIAHMIELMSGQNPIFMKTHNAMGEAEGIFLIPEVMTKKALYVVRDPRDVMVSYARHMNLSHEEATEAICNETQKIVHDDNLFHIVSSWGTHAQSWIGNEKFTCGVVHYEKLVDNPAEHFKGILDFCEIKFEQSKFDNALKQTEFKNMKKQEQEKGFLENPGHSCAFFHSGAYGNWHDVDGKLIEKIEETNKDMMEMFGYLEKKAA